MVAAPLILGGNEAAVAPALAAAEETRRSAAAVAPALAAEDVKSTAYEYVQFDVQLSDGEAGSFVVEVRPDWAPVGAARFTTLSRAGFFEGCRFFRVLEGFIAQVGWVGWVGGWAVASFVFRGRAKGLSFYVVLLGLHIYFMFYVQQHVHCSGACFFHAQSR